MRVLGIDLGSREVKIVLMEDNKIIQKNESKYHELLQKLLQF